MTIRIGIAGISGRMGRLLAEEVPAAGAILAGGTSRAGAAPAGVPVLADIEALCAASDVVIDFTHAATARAPCRSRGGGGHALRARLLGPVGRGGSRGGRGCDAHPHRLCRQLRPGVNLFLAIAERMAAALPAAQYDAEIVEMHHRQKVDAPSGTAVALGRAVAAGRGTTLEEAGRESGRDGHCGARGTGTIGFAALRGGQVVGEHTLIFAAASEHISLTHRSFDRRVYATGAVRAALWVKGRAAGLYGMRDVLGM